MTSYEQSQEELKQHFDEHLDFIRRSCLSFDDGIESEAKRIATSLRVLLHDSEKSQSVLGLLGIKESVDFLDTAFSEAPGNIGSHVGLTLIAVYPDGAKYIPKLDDAITGTRKIKFDEWWNQSIFIDQKKVPTSRRALVLSVSNKDGGAHVDPKLNEKYADLSRRNALGLFSRLNGIQTPIGAPELAALRQLGHEIIKTFDSTYIAPQRKNDAQFISGGWDIHIATPEEIASTNPATAQKEIMYKETGRNQLCPCGSGKKYKKCHG